MDGIIHISYGGPKISIRCGKRDCYFEMHPYCGPMRLYANGEPHPTHWPDNHRFWIFFQRWLDGGQKLDEINRAILNTTNTRNE